MPPYDDYSDSDDSDADEVQTTVLLGLPDGPIESSSDLSRLRISRIGGLPVHTSFNWISRLLDHLSDHLVLSLLVKVFPTGVPRPSLSASFCSSCNNPAQLLVQLWCPFESSPYDRVLDVWVCSRASCQRKDGRCAARQMSRWKCLS